MGIRGLGKYIRLRLPNVHKTLTYTAHEGERWGIDCSCLLYRARGASLSTLTVVAGLIVRLRRNGIEPVFVFDGKPPTAKSEVLDQRRATRVAVHREMADIRNEMATATTFEKIDMERRHAVLQARAPSVTSMDKDEVKQFLYSAGVLFVTANGEADDVLGYLCRQGYLSAVVSTDMDMLARGVKLLVIPETNDATVLTQILLSDVLSGMRLSYEQFVNACVLMGSDYSARGWQSMEPASAIDKARRGVDWGSIDVSGSVCYSLERGANMLMGSDIEWDNILGERQRLRFEAGPPLSEPDKLVVFSETHGWPKDWFTILSKH
jgi:flap endonuclease-1